MTIRFPSGSSTAALLADARTGVLRRIRRGRRLARLGVIGGILLVASSGTAATLAVAQASRDRIGTTVTCFVHDDPASFSSSAGMAQADGAPRRAVDLRTKREMCGLVWRSGLAQAARTGHWPDVDPNTSTIPVPRLALCVLADGTTGGFPIEPPARTAAAVCERLGLAPEG